MVPFDHMLSCDWLPGFKLSQWIVGAHWSKAEEAVEIFNQQVRTNAGMRFLIHNLQNSPQTEATVLHLSRSLTHERSSDLSFRLLCSTGSSHVGFSAGGPCAAWSPASC